MTMTSDEASEIFIFVSVTMTTPSNKTVLTADRYDRDGVINQMVMDIDANGDGIVTENELHSEFVVLMDKNQGTLIHMYNAITNDERGLNH